MVCFERVHSSGLLLLDNQVNISMLISSLSLQLTHSVNTWITLIGQFINTQIFKSVLLIYHKRVGV